MNKYDEEEIYNLVLNVANNHLGKTTLLAKYVRHYYEHLPIVDKVLRPVYYLVIQLYEDWFNLIIYYKGFHNDYIKNTFHSLKELILTIPKTERDVSEKYPQGITINLRKEIIKQIKNNKKRLII